MYGKYCCYTENVAQLYILHIYIYHGTSYKILPKNLCELCEIREIHLSFKDQKHLVVFLGFKSSR